MVAVVELFGSVESVSIMSSSKGLTPVLESAIAATRATGTAAAVSQDSLEIGEGKALSKETNEKLTQEILLASGEEDTAVLRFVFYFRF